MTWNWMLILNLRRRLLAITATAIRDRAVATGDYPEAGAPSRIPLRAYLSAREIREPDFGATTKLPRPLPFSSIVRPAAEDGQHCRIRAKQIAPRTFFGLEFHLVPGRHKGNLGAAFS